MYQQIDDKELIEFVSKNLQENLISWSKCDLTKLSVCMISEGVFLCTITDQTVDYQCVVLRLDKLNPLRNTLITSPKSCEIITAYEFHRCELGPKLLSVFKNGRVEEWINGQPIRNQFRNDKTIQQMVAESIAKIHSIDKVRTEINDQFLPNKVKIFLKLIYKNKSDYGYPILMNFINKNISAESSIDKSKKIDSLESEFEFLTDNIIKLDASNQIVFCHNDLSQETIFRRSDSAEIYFLNYDLSGYNYRSYDLAHYLNNVAFDFENPPDRIDQLNYLSDDELKDFLSSYLKKVNQLRNSNLINLDDLIKQVSFFKIYSAYLSILVSSLTTLSNQLVESNLDFLKLRIQVYLKLKNEYLASFN